MRLIHFTNTSGAIFQLENKHQIVDGLMEKVEDRKLDTKINQYLLKMCGTKKSHMGIQEINCVLIFGLSDCKSW